MDNRSKVFVAAMAAVFAMGASRVTLAVTVVTAANPDGWAFNSNDSNGDVISDSDHIGGYVSGPATPPLGIGSAELKITNGQGDGSEQLRNSNYDGVALNSLTSLSYSTYTVTNNGSQFPYLALYISTQGNGIADDKLYFEPPYQTHASGNPSLIDQGATVMGQWQTWDALDGGWWDDIDNNPGDNVLGLASYEAEYPNATIVNADGLGGVRFAVGYSSSGDNYEGYVDNFTMGVNGVSTTFDFEPTAATPEPASMGLLALGAVGLLARRRRREA